jgi:hypothetical protein
VYEIAEEGCVKYLKLLTAVACMATLVPTIASADARDGRHGARQAGQNIAREHREAAREIEGCGGNRKCIVREVREGQREVNREARRAQRGAPGQVKHAPPVRQAQHVPARHARHAPVRHAKHAPAHHARPAPVRDYRHARHFDERRHFRNAAAHYHPGGRYCTDARHIVHLRDAWYRGDRRWYRDGRYWNEYDYVSRYYRGHGHRHHRDDDFVKGLVIGAAVVGVIAAIANDDN